jgi:hypothetical protein
MNIFGEVRKELLGMFVADAKLTSATLVLVAVVSALVFALRVDPLVAGSVLLFGCLAILVAAAVSEATFRTDR